MSDDNPNATEPTDLPEPIDSDAGTAAEELPSDPAQDNRDRRIWWALVAAGVVGMLLVMWFGRPLLTGRLDAARKLDQATAILVTSNPAMASVDTAVKAQVLTQEAASSADVSSTIISTQRQFKEAVRMIDDGYPHLTEDEQRRANLVKASLQNRIVMLDAAPTILEANAAAAAAKPLAEDAWTRALEADRSARAAVVEYNKLTKVSAANATGLNAKAEVGFAAAADLFARASAAFPKANLGVYVTYIEQRRKQLALSRQSDSALAAGNNAQANGIIASYNAEDAKSLALSKQLPASPTKVIVEAYEAATEAARAKYDSARIKAEESDQALKKF
jgi:hypothetical protein